MLPHMTGSLELLFLYASLEKIEASVGCNDVLGMQTSGEERQVH